jgi:flagellar P-ring protein precursor FlgI
MNKRLLAFALALMSVSLEAAMIQVRNAARPLGQRENQISAIGLVAGLNGSGDTRNTAFTQQALSNLLGTYGINDAAAAIKSRNVAVVMITANIGAYLKEGDRVDVVISSMGDATSLAGGVLVQTPLKGADGKVYAVAQGPVSVGGQLGGRVGSLLTAGPTTTGRIPGGALVEAEIPATVVGENDIIRYALQLPDYTTSARMAMAINETFAQLKPEFSAIAAAKDASVVEVQIPQEYRQNPVEFMAAVEQVNFNVEERSNKVVVNERTGTVVMGMKVALDTIAVAHGNLNVNIQVTSRVNEPPFFSPGTSALYFNHTNLKVEGGGGNLVTLPESATIADLVTALNLIGATPRDVISILQAVKAAGALHADLEIM